MVNLFVKKKDVDFFSLLISAAENTLESSVVFRTAMNGDKSPAEYFKEIKDLEHKGDNMTHQIYKELNKVFITPIDREDILELASRTDDVIDGIESTIALFDYLSVDYSNQWMKEFAAIIVDACQHIVEAYKLLIQKKYPQVMEHTVKINSLENEGDRLQREAIREIFQTKKDPYEDFKLKEIYEHMEQITDACEDVANILESIVMKYS